MNKKERAAYELLRCLARLHANDAREAARMGDVQQCWHLTGISVHIDERAEVFLVEVSSGKSAVHRKPR